MVISEIYNMQPMPDPPNPMSQATPALLEMGQTNNMWRHLVSYLTMEHVTTMTELQGA